MPKVLASTDRQAFARRLAEYLSAESIPRCLVIFHGGEPLLAGWRSIVSFAEELRNVAVGRRIEFGIQTNGLLLTDEAAQAFADTGIGVSLSLDGPRRVNDLHRLTHRGRSSFDGTAHALEILRGYPRAFAGVIAVIDPTVPPREVIEYFSELAPPKLDLLLPDAHHLRPPLGRFAHPTIYRDWLIEAFDLWLDEFSHLEIRTFEALLDAIAGLNSGTDAFGFGDVSLVTIETDGSYHDLDVLKITRDGATPLGGTVQDTPIAIVANSTPVQAHRMLLRKDGLCEKCRSCSEVNVCGGGSVPHRYAADGFSHPTVYCDEMYALVRHARERLTSMLRFEKIVPASSCDLDMAEFEYAETGQSLMAQLRSGAVREYTTELRNILKAVSGDSSFTNLIHRFESLDQGALERTAARPGVVAWCRAMRGRLNKGASLSIDGRALAPTADYLATVIEGSGASGLRVGADDEWLRLPFGNAIIFEGSDATADATPLVEEALSIIEAWRPALAAEIRLACSDIQLIRDPKAHPDKIVSFSDDSVPGALFVSIRQGSGLVSAMDLADSLIHEHRHQKLYLLEREVRLVNRNSLKVVSPWREDLRPPSGLLHAAFVFTELRRFWIWVAGYCPQRHKEQALAQVDDNTPRLVTAFQALHACPLTSPGRDLVQVLEKSCHVSALAA